MTLPGDLTVTTVTGTFLDAIGFPQQGTVTFTPSAVLTDATGTAVIEAATRRYVLSPAGSFTSDPLISTDNATISPSGWTYSVVVAINGLPAQTWNILLPHSASPVDISTITPTVPQTPVTSYLEQSGGTMSGTVTFTATPPLKIPGGAAAGDYLASDSSGNAAWSGGPLAIANGGTAGGTQQAAINALTGTQSAGQYLRSNGTNASLSAIQAADVPVLNQYSQVFSPLSYGAVGNGSTDDTTAVLAAFSAAAAAGGTVDLGAYTFLTSSAIAVYSGMHVKGRNNQTTLSGAIVNATTSIFTFTGSLNDITFENCYLNATGSGSAGGHVWDASAGPSISFLRILGVRAMQSSTTHCVWYQMGGTYINCMVDNLSNLWQSASATVPGWQSLQCGVTTASWANLRTNAGNNPNVPFFNFDFQTRGGYSQSMSFKNVVCEQSPAGMIYVAGGFGIYLDNVKGWDTVEPAYGNAFSFVQSADGYPCNNIVVRNSGNTHSSAPYYDVYADVHTSQLLLDTVGAWGTPPLLNVPAAQTTLINCGNSAYGPDSSVFPAIAVGSLAYTPVNLADGTSIAVNAALGSDFRLTLTGGGHTLANPTYPSDGQRVVFQITQPASGGPYTITYGTAYEFSDGLPAPVLSISAGYTDLIGFVYNAAKSKWLCDGYVIGFA